MSRTRKYFAVSCLTVLFQVGLFGESPKPAAVTTLTFDDLAAGTRVDEDYASQGVHFLNDYQANKIFRTGPQVTAYSKARSSPHILVNTAYDPEIFSSGGVPLQIWFDKPVTGVGMYLGTTGQCTQTLTATVSLYDCAGNLTAKSTAQVSSAFNTPLEVDDSSGKTVLVQIDYGSSTCPEAIDDFAFQFSSQSCVATTTPEVKITSPSDYQTVNTSKIMIQGTITEKSGIIKSLKVNGSAVGFHPVSGKPGQFEFTEVVSLIEGGNTITAMVINGSGQKGSHSIVVNYGSPSSVALKAFHLTQRGVMQNTTCDVDGPMVAGKSAIVRVDLTVKSSTGATTYVSTIELSLWRKTTSGDSLVDTIQGETYSPAVAGFSGPSQMSGIHFWIPGETLDAAGDYKFTFQAYVGTTAVGSALSPACSASYVTFTETNPLRLLILPVEAGFNSTALQGTSHSADGFGALDTVDRAFPVRDGVGSTYYSVSTGVRYYEASPLQLCDGSAAMQKAFPNFCQSTGFTWKFIDKHSSGLLRKADTESVSDPTNTTICGGANTTIGGRIKSSTTTTFSFLPALGVFLAGAHPGWQGAKFADPLDTDHDGDVDKTDQAHYISEFYDAQTKTWMTNQASYDVGETFRFFRDLDGDQCNDTATDPQSDIRQLSQNQSTLLWGQSNDALTAYNKIYGSGSKKMDLASLWFPDKIIAGVGFGGIGPGQGDSPGKLSWVRVQHTTGLTHELGHNVGGLNDLYYDNVADDLKSTENAWLVYVNRTSYQPSKISAVMSWTVGPDDAVFLKSNYQTLFDKLKVTSTTSSSTASSVAQVTGKQVTLSGFVSFVPGIASQIRAALSSGWAETAPDPSSPYSLVFRGSGGEQVACDPIPLPMPAAPPEGYDSWPDDVRPFQAVAAFPEATASLELRWSPGGGQPDVVLARIDRSATAPTVRSVVPEGGTYGANDRVLLQWEADDSDSETLSASVYYSPDGGENWQLLASDVGMEKTIRARFRGEFTWNLSGSPGTKSANGKIRVIVSDGLNAGEGLNAGQFTIGGKAPQVAIIAPRPNQVFLECARPFLRAIAVDPEARSIRQVWAIDGVNTETPLAAGALKPGQHTISFTATDYTDNLQASAQVVIFVMADSDCDGMSDEYEESHNLDPGFAGDAASDTDQDGLSNFTESVFGTRPDSRDTDGDSMDDAWEADNGFNPTSDDGSQDVDHDGYSNRDEYRAGTNPRDASSVPRPAVEASVTYPQLALGGGYECILIASNSTGNKWEGTLYLRQRDEGDWSGPWRVNGEDRTGSSHFSFTLEPHSTRKFTLVGGDDELRAGYLQVNAGSGSQIEDVALSFFYRLEHAATMQDSTGVPAGIIGKSFVFPVEKGGSIDTGFAWSPVPTGLAVQAGIATAEPGFSVMATLYSANGQEVERKPLPFEGHLARFFSEIFSGVQNGFVGKVVLESPQDIYLTVLRMEITPEQAVQLTSVPPVPVPDDPGPLTTVYPQMGLGGGYQCSFLVANKTAQRWKGKAYLREGTEHAWPYPAAVNGQNISGIGYFDIDLGPNQTAKFVLTGDSTARAGYLRIAMDPGPQVLEANAPQLSAKSLAVSFFYNYLQSQKLADSTGVPSSTGARSLVFPAERSARVNTGFAWTAESWEPEQTTAFKIHLTLFDSTGTKTGERELTYEGHQARFFSELFDGVPAEFLGKVVVEADQRLSLTVVRLEMTQDGFQLTSVPPSLLLESPRPTCAAMTGFQEYLATHPEYAAERVRIERQIDTYLEKLDEEGADALRTAVITIPVVVHVLYKTSSQNISDSQIKSQIDILNQDFRKLNLDVGKTPAVFKSLVADPKIQFKLAVRDPNCNTTTGIVRKQTTKDEFAYDSDNRTNSTGAPMKFNSTGGDNAWPRDKYLNLWVCNLQSGLLGFSSFPGDPASIDGVVIDYAYFGNIGTATAPFDLGRTATHEIGHWLDMRHIWGDDGKETDKCSGTDYVGDTPNQYLQNTGNPTYPKVSCNNGPNGDLFMNYMDYCDDKSLYMFTSGQVDRMEAALFETRNAILASDALIPVSQGADLFSQDGSDDVGAEPNTATSVLYRSLDIWIRNIKDGVTKQEHQNPVASTVNYVYVRVRNKGCSDSQSATVKLYWAKASTGLSWPKPWDGSVTTPAVMGGLIGEAATGVVKGGGYTLLVFEWTPPSPSNYTSFGADKAHFCLLSRIETSTTAPYGMTTTETSDLVQNVRNNNNIVWKNVSVSESSSSGSGSKEASTVVGNYGSRTASFSLKFFIPPQPGEPPIFDLGTVVLNLGQQLYANWAANGSRGRGIQVWDPPLLKITDPEAILENISLTARELRTIRVIFIPKETIIGRHVYELDIEQYESTVSQEKLVGGQTFFIKLKNP